MARVLCVTSTSHPPLPPRQRRTPLHFTLYFSLRFLNVIVTWQRLLKSSASQSCLSLPPLKFCHSNRVYRRLRMCHVLWGQPASAQRCLEQKSNLHTGPWHVLSLNCFHGAHLPLQFRPLACSELQMLTSGTAELEQRGRKGLLQCSISAHRIRAAIYASASSHKDSEGSAKAHL